MTSNNVVYLSLGANMDALKNLQIAVNLLRQQCHIEALSSVYQSPAFGWEDQPDFLDICVKISTDKSPLEFKQHVLDPIEKQLGRDRKSQQSKYGPLPIDIDILLWGETAFEFGEKPWKVPDKGILKYAAVAVPLAEIAPQMKHPTDGRTIAEIAESFDDKDAVKLTNYQIKVG